MACGSTKQKLCLYKTLTETPLLSQTGKKCLALKRLCTFLPLFSYKHLKEHASRDEKMLDSPKEMTDLGRTNGSLFLFPYCSLLLSTYPMNISHLPRGVKWN